MRLPSWLSQHLAAVRTLLVLTLLFGLAYPLAMVAVARIPGLSGSADGSLVSQNGTLVGSSLIGQSFTDAKGNALKQYFQSRPSQAGPAGYDPTATSASNLGPESVVDTLPDPADPTSGKQSLLTQVCSRSKAVGELDGRPFGELREAYATHQPTVTALWPEHFDLACQLGDAAAGSLANYGASPGDGPHAVPYLYVTPWTEQQGAFWNEGAFASLSLADFVDAGFQPQDFPCVHVHVIAHTLVGFGIGANFNYRRNRRTDD